MRFKDSKFKNSKIQKNVMSSGVETSVIMFQTDSSAAVGMTRFKDSIVPLGTMGRNKI